MKILAGHVGSVRFSCVLGQTCHAGYFFAVVNIVVPAAVL